MERKGLFFLLLMVLSAAAAAPAAAFGEFFLHEQDLYWWYVREEPAFSTVIPSGAERYVHKAELGCERLEMTLDDGAVILTVGSLPGSSMEPALASIQGKVTPLLADTEVLDDREFRSSSGLTGYVYAVAGTDARGRRSMLRSVFFEHEGHVAVLTIVLEGHRYEAELREYWLRMVNDFQWN